MVILILVVGSPKFLPIYSRYSSQASGMEFGQKTFKERRTFGQRVREVESVQREHPNKVPVIIERYANENQLPPLDRSKFLIPEHVTVAELMKILRRRLQLNSSQSIFLLLNGRNLPATAATFAEIYFDERDPDGFLYIVYASHEAFG